MLFIVIFYFLFWRTHFEGHSLIDLLRGLLLADYTKNVVSSLGNPVESFNIWILKKNNNNTQKTKEQKKIYHMFVISFRI